MSETVLSKIINQGHFDQDDLKLFEQHGFMLWQNNADYSDLEFDVTFESESEHSDEKTFNVYLTFDWSNKTSYMLLGTNLGEGFNSAIEVPHLGVSLREDIKAAIELHAHENSEFIGLVNRHPQSWSILRSAVDRLSSELEK